MNVRFGNGPPQPSHYQIVWGDDEAYICEEITITKVLNELRKEMAGLSADLGHIDNVPRHVYNWLVDGRLPGMEARVCRMIDGEFKTLGYEDAVAMYM